jgi:glycine/D-amino acid oxidase-like deaminating enzyme/nitrite reductase/ring-hydroxylating ferredoxin subunit
MSIRLDTTPFWMESAPLPPFPAIDRDIRADVVVVGGGITGLTAAYQLSVAGRSVALLERRGLAEIDTGHTTAHLTMVLDTSLTDLSKYFGNDDAQAAWDAGLAAIHQIDTVVRSERIACDFAWVPGYLHARDTEDAEEAARLREEADLASSFGFDAAYVDRVPLAGAPGVRLDNQARFHPRKYLAGLARAIASRGGQIFEHSEVHEFSEAPRFVRANGRRIDCDWIVLATHTPLVGMKNLLTATLFQTKLALYSTYVVAGRVARGTVPDVMLWDTDDPYHYLRLEPQRDADLVIYGGEDHKTGQAADTTECYKRLEKKLKELVPGVEVSHRWSGQVIETADGLPYIGETAERQFASTGYAGNGMTFGTLGGMMAADYVLERKNPWTELFHPERKKVRGAAWDYLRENKDYPYYFVRDRFAGAKGRSLRAVPRGRGRVIEYNEQQVAAYRDEGGEVSLRSAVCTHMGCVVDWNVAERTWDCPCHGSRFKTDGTVIGGPAETPLGKID